MGVATYTPPSDRIIHHTAVDFGERWSLGTAVNLMQYDKTLPIIAVSLYSGGQPYTIPSSADLNVRVGKPDGTKVYNPVLGCNPQRTICYIEATRQICAAYGQALAVLELIIDSNIAGSSYILFDIARNPAQENAIVSSNEYKILNDIVAEARDALQKPPKIQNGVWVVWDSDKKAYVDTGYSASGTPGPAGTGIDNIVLNSDYTLTITYGNTKYTTKSIRGATGAKGETGSTGAPGVGIEQAVFNDDYTLTILFSDGSSFTTPSLRGATGSDGKGFKILGYYQSVSSLSNGIKNPSAGDAYGVGTGEPYNIYVWDAVNSKWVNNGALQGAAGKDGTTFTPSVSTDGVLSWTNDGGKPNPASVNIKGKTGAPGMDGFNGTTFTPSVSADGVLSWTNDGGKQNPASVNIKGPAGEAGPGSELFYVGCGIHAEDTYDESVTHTKTYDEILAAYKAGKACYARVKLFGAYNTNLLLLPLAEVDEAQGYVEFALTKMTQGDTPEELMVSYVQIDSNGNAEGYWGPRYTGSSTSNFLPTVAASDNGKFLQVANGAWAAVKVPDAEGGSY